MRRGVLFAALSATAFEYACCADADASAVIVIGDCGAVYSCVGTFP